MKNNEYIIQKRKFHDAWALIAFLITTITIVTVSMSKFDLKPTNIDINHFPNILKLSVGYLVGFCITVTLLLLFIPAIVMHVSFILCSVLMIVLGLTDSSVPGMIFMIISGIFIFVYYIWSARKNIKFSAGVCKSSTMIITKKVYVALPLLLAIFILLPLQSFFSYSVFLNLMKKYFYLCPIIALQFFWLYSGLNYLLRVHISSIVAIDLLSDDDAVSFVFQCFKNSFFCLGSVFFGALLVAIIQTAKLIIDVQRNMNTRRNNGIVAVILMILGIIISLFLDILQALIESMNEFAYVYLALYGKSYIGSIKGAFEILTEKNLILLNSMCIRPVIFILSYIGSQLFYFLLKKIGDRKENYYDLIIAIVMFIYIMIFMEIFDAGIKALMFVHNKEPQVIKEKDPETYELLKVQAAKNNIQ